MRRTRVVAHRPRTFRVAIRCRDVPDRRPTLRNKVLRNISSPTLNEVFAFLLHLLERAGMLILGCFEILNADSRACEDLKAPAVEG
jgi:hypothetical protein